MDSNCKNRTKHLVVIDGHGADVAGADQCHGEESVAPSAQVDRSLVDDKQVGNVNGQLRVDTQQQPYRRTELAPRIILYKICLDSLVLIHSFTSWFKRITVSIATKRPLSCHANLRPYGPDDCKQRLAFDGSVG